MRRALSHSAAAITLIVGLLLGPIARADVLTNGNFEDGPTISAANPVFAVAPGNGALTGWTVTAGAIDIVTDNYWVPLSGHRSIVLSSTGPGSIEQAFATGVGAVYRLTFWMSGEPFSSPTIKNLRVTAGSMVQDYTFDITPAWHWDMAWAQHTLDFTADAATTTLDFSSEDATQWGPAIDSVKVEQLSAGVPPLGRPLAFAPVAPDPVRDGGRMAFTLPAAGHVRIAVHDVQGRQVAVATDADFAAGPNGVAFSPRAWGMSPGLYLAVLHTAGRTLIRRFTVLD